MPKGIPKSGFNQGWFRQGDPRHAKTPEHAAKVGAAVSKTNKGRKLTASWKKHISEGMSRRTGSKQFKKKIGNTAYLRLHRMMRNKYGYPQKCEVCGREKPPKGKGLTYDYFHWANKTGKYLDDRSDWLRLCTICHRRYDLKMYVTE